MSGDTRQVALSRYRTVAHLADIWLARTLAALAYAVRTSLRKEKNHLF